MPVYAEGLGTVQAFYTVTVTARVDGQVDKIGFTEGQDVKKGALLAQIDPRPFQAALGVAIATRDKDRAQLQNAHLDMERYQLLAPEDLASKQTVDTQKALIAQLGAQVKGDEAAIDNARTQLDYTTIRSPIDGRTGIRLVDPGNIVHATDTTGIVVVTQLEPISVIFSLPEESFEQVSAALQRGAVQAVALSRDRNEELDRGTLALIDNQIDQTTGTLRLKATLPNKQHHLWPGQFVNMRVLTQVQHQVLTMPAERAGARARRALHLSGESRLHDRGRTRSRSANRTTTRGGAEGTQGRRQGRRQQPVPPAARQPYTRERAARRQGGASKPAEQAP